MRQRGIKGKKTISIKHLTFVSPLLVFVIILILSLFISGFFTIKQVDVKAEKINCATQEDLKSLSSLLGQNFLLVNSGKIADEAKKKYVCVKEVTIYRQFPNKVTLNVFGREAVAILVSQKKEATSSDILKEFNEATDSAYISPSEKGESFMVDSEGVIFSRVFDEVDTPKIYLGQFLTLGQKKEELINNALKILEKIETFGIEVKEAKIYPENLFLINSMPRMIFKLDDKIDIQLASLQLILGKAKIDQSRLEFIDLRFDKPVVKFAPKIIIERDSNGKR